MGYNKKITDEELIQWIKSFETIKEMRESNNSRYIMATKRCFHNYFPPKRTKTGKIVGLYSKEVESKREEKKKLREEKRLKLQEERELKRIRREERSKSKKTPTNMYKSIDLDNGNIICGRCLEEKKPSKFKNFLCTSCNSRYVTGIGTGTDHNKWNVRDDFCNTTIKHHEKTFNIGIRVDERTQNYLTMIGYGFIFKDVYTK